MDINELKWLWKVSFNDSENYVDFYFNRRFKPENTRIRSVDGRIICAAQFFRYDITYGGKILKGVYILGLNTHPDYRRQGFATGIIGEILEEQVCLGMEVAFLIPSEEYLFSVYRKLGFSELITVYQTHVVVGATFGRPRAHTVRPYAVESNWFPRIRASAIFAFYDKFYRSLNSAVLKTYDDFIFALEDVTVSGGRIDICDVDGEIRGFAATEGSVVKELLYLDEAARDALLSALLVDAGGKGLTVITPNPEPGSIKKIIGMARALRLTSRGAHCASATSAPLPLPMKESYGNLLLN